MIKCKFKYDEKLLNKITNTTLKTSNLINQILIGLIAVAVAVMFIMGYKVSGIVFLAVGVILVAGVIFVNKLISKSNKMLLGQQVDIVFSETDMVMNCSMGGEKLYTAKLEYSAVKKVVEKNDLAYLYFDKKSIIILPKQSFISEQDYQKVMELVGNNYIM